MPNRIKDLASIGTLPDFELFDSKKFKSPKNSRTNKASPLKEISLPQIELLDSKLLKKFVSRVVVEPFLTRKLVSFQANKTQPLYRWYKYKEAFSAALVEYLFNRYQVTSGRILDPFTGVGTAQFVAASLGLESDGIELLPIGQQIIAAHQLVRSAWTDDDSTTLRRWYKLRPWQQSEERVVLPELRITKGAYPPDTHDALERYLGTLLRENEKVQSLLRFAALCVLESVSYTRKDGQYLRWDHRS